MELNINKSSTIGTDAVEVSAERANRNGVRRSIIIINTSPAGQVITIAIDNPAVAGQGIVLNVGGLWSDNADGGYLPTQKQITAVSSAAGGTLAIQERVITQ
jgi:hypothetical protein